ncbi:AAA family ATPase [Tropicimonas sp. TH_r6]|uniref:ExeA family protein n=1 Tax=Tropicimonas sp. TH_r6 TaxID=3082085 RepID=UPI00295298CD|nr:AAA family ATPase [Tropicimonas sp. TH_r6]MDV7141177.1 AAA family ATPase [Tropicimonas sp. TH_r6]
MSMNMYEGYFGLEKRPFTLVPDPDFLFWTPQHRRAFAVLEFGVMSQAPITLITGEVGAGKTTLLQALLGRMTEELKVGVVSNAQGERGELLQWALNALGLELHDGESHVQSFQRLQDQLLADYAAGRRVVLIFDEAQNLTKQALEELRMLTNINSSQDMLLQIILVGQPELRDLVRAPDMSQLAQRVAAHYHLQGLDADHTAGFVAHRLRQAGGTGDEITRDAASLVHQATQGLPRLINQLCDLTMLYAWSGNQTVVTEGTVREVLDDGVFFGGGLGDGKVH